MKTKDGLWRLSPSGLYSYTECRSCFWIDNHYRRAPMLPLLLNSAMDSVLKARYDQYRARGEFPPEAAALSEQGIAPFTDAAQLVRWREDVHALRVIDEEAGYVLVGRIDDVLVENGAAEDKRGGQTALRGLGRPASSAGLRLVPADYKSSGNAPAEDKQKYYRDQLAAYGLMFARHGHAVSDRAYLLHYYVADKNDPSIAVKFAAHVDRVAIDVAGIEEKLRAMVRLLDGEYPGHNPDCERCAYYDGRDGVAGG